MGPWLDLVLDDPLIDSHAALIIGNEREELRRTFIEGDTRGFLKAVADPLVKPVIEGRRRRHPPETCRPTTGSTFWNGWPTSRKT